MRKIFITLILMLSIFSIANAHPFKSEKELEKVSEEAIEQIINKKYDISLKERGIRDITLIGIAFFGKILKVNYK